MIISCQYILGITLWHQGKKLFAFVVTIFKIFFKKPWEAFLKVLLIHLISSVLSWNIFNVVDKYFALQSSLSISCTVEQLRHLPLHKSKSLKSKGSMLVGITYSCIVRNNSDYRDIFGTLSSIYCEFFFKKVNG